MKEIIIGTKGNAEIIAEKSTLAVNVGSGSLEVFATPMMAMLLLISWKMMKPQLEQN